MSNLLLKNANTIFSNEKLIETSILIETGKISTMTADEIKADEVIDLSGLTLFAGFIDAHIHGAVGVDVNAASADDLYKMAKFLAEKGTTAWMPTFVPDRTKLIEMSLPKLKR